MVEYECENKDGRTEYEMQRIIIYGLVMLVGLIVMITVILFQVYEYRQRVRKEREINEAKLAKQQHQLEKITAELALSRAQQQHFSEEHFMQRLEEQIDLRLSDPMLDVEKLAVEMGISRTGLYRKVKAATGHIQTSENISGISTEGRFLGTFSGDLLNVDDINRALEENDMDAVIHFAAFSQVAGEGPEEPSFRRYAGDVLGSLYVAGAVVVEGQDVVSGIEEGQYTVAADVAVPSGHHDLHSKTSL